MEQLCDVCQSKMKLVKKGKATKNGKVKYTIRRWQCPNCENIQTTYGDGWGDNHSLPASAIEAQNKFFKKQEENQNERVIDEIQKRNR